MSSHPNNSLLADESQRTALVAELPAELPWVAGDFDRHCGMEVGNDQAARDRFAGWYAAFRNGPLPRLPVVLPYFVDLGSLIIHEQPAFRNVEPSLSDYVEHHLMPLAAQPAVRMVRRRLTQGSTTSRVEAEIVARFIRDVLLWLRRFWHQRPEFRWLTTDPRAEWLRREDACEAFLTQIPRLLADQGHVWQQAIPPLERFRLGNMTGEEFSKQQAARDHRGLPEPNAELIAACAESPDLDSRKRQPPPVISRISHWTELHQCSGERVAARQVRKTTELRKLHEVVPHELALLAAPPDGPRQFLHKLMNDGVLIWDRQHFSRPVTWKRVLLCCAAAVGATANTANSAYYLNPRLGGAGVGVSDSLDTHARRLIFDLLRDLGASFDSSPLHIDVRVMLHDTRNGGGRDWQMSREDLECSQFGDRFDFMLELESRAPGFFLEGAFPPQRDNLALRRFFERAVHAGPYDGRVFVLIGAPEHLNDLLPEGLGQRAKQSGADAVYVIRLNESPDHWSVSHAASFDDPQLRWRFVPIGSDDLRLVVRQAVCGAPRAGRRGVSADLPEF